MTAPEDPGSVAPRIRVTLSWRDGPELVTRELRAEETPRVFGRLTDRRITDLTVGREHFEIHSPDGKRWRVERYATLNGLRLRRAGETEELDVDGKAILDDGDQLLAGNSVFTFKIAGLPPDPDQAGTTIRVQERIALREILTKKQSEVVEVLCRPAYEGTDLWASNDEIARVLRLKKDTVRAHLKGAYERLYRAGSSSDFSEDVVSLHKRSVLVQIAIAAGFGRGSHD